jgi:hypothetical protein
MPGSTVARSRALVGKAPHWTSMLFDVGESIREMLSTLGGVPPDVEVVFDAPTKDWAARRNGPAVDVFLYDIRENLDRRQNLLEFAKDEDITVGRLPATRWFNCSYLITAWTQRPEDEHRLLGGIISGLLTTHSLPADCRQGALATMEREIFLTLGRPLGSERSISDIWSALGGELKPSLDLVMVVPFEPVGVFAVGPPVLEAPSLFIGRSGEVPMPAKGDPGRTPGHRRSKAAEEIGESDVDDRRMSARDGEAVAEEEAIGGTATQPGRRFRFSLHEPGSRPPSAPNR